MKFNSQAAGTSQRATDSSALDSTATDSAALDSSAATSAASAPASSAPSPQSALHQALNPDSGGATSSTAAQNAQLASGQAVTPGSAASASSQANSDQSNASSNAKRAGKAAQHTGKAAARGYGAYEGWRNSPAGKALAKAKAGVDDVKKGIIDAKAGWQQAKAKVTYAARNLGGKIANGAKHFASDPLGAIQQGAHAVYGVGKAALSKTGDIVSSLVAHTAHAVSHVSAHLGSAISTAATALSSHAVATGVTTVALVGGVVGSIFGYHGGSEIVCNSQPMSVQQQLAGNVGSVGGDWTKPGTSAYQNAQAVWKYWQAKGFSGAAIAGIMGNVERESHFNPASNEAGANGTPGHAGFGLYQVTPGTNILTPHYKGPTVDSESDQLWYDYRGAQVTHGVGHAPWLSTYASQDDAAAAAAYWEKHVEAAGVVAMGERQAAAKKAYQVFGGANIKANPSLFGSNNVAAATANDAAAAQQDAAACGNAGAGNGDVPDGTGSIKETARGYQSYNFNHLPGDMQPFVPDPRKVGLHWGSSTGWMLPGGQCVDFSESYFHAIWSPHPGHVSGNGKDIAPNFASEMGGHCTNTPHAGACCSVPANVPGVSPGPWGHTFVVVHVLANGDFIGLEENFPPNSGDDIGKPNTWDVNLVSKQEYQKYNFQFFTPSGKYHLNFG